MALTARWGRARCIPYQAPATGTVELQGRRRDPEAARKTASFRLRSWRRPLPGSSVRAWRAAARGHGRAHQHLLPRMGPALPGLTPAKLLGGVRGLLHRPRIHPGSMLSGPAQSCLQDRGPLARGASCSFSSSALVPSHVWVDPRMYAHMVLPCGAADRVSFWVRRLRAAVVRRPGQLGPRSFAGESTVLGSRWHVQHLVRRSRPSTAPSRPRRRARASLGTASEPAFSLPRRFSARDAEKGLLVSIRARLVSPPTLLESSTLATGKHPVVRSMVV